MTSPLGIYLKELYEIRSAGAGVKKPPIMDP
jgi:hypothetical protein